MARKKPCETCPFGPNRVKAWGYDTLQTAIRVANAERANGVLKPKQPQTCHQVLENNGENYVAPKSVKEHCVGDRDYLNGITHDAT